MDQDKEVIRSGKMEQDKEVMSAWGRSSGMEQDEELIMGGAVVWNRMSK